MIGFARDLRGLRAQAGNPSYRELSARAHYSVGALSQAVDGRKLPSLAVTLAYVTACGGDTAAWERRWKTVTAELSTEDDRQVGADRDGDSRAPYAGLAVFEMDDADRFFGRERLVADLVKRLGRQRFLGVFGPSGCGKSSLLRAGLIAHLREDPTTKATPIVLFTPGVHPVEECAINLAEPAGVSPGALRDEILADPGHLGLRIRQIMANRPAGCDLVLVVDQFEEIFTLCTDLAERDRFITALITATRPDSRARVVLGSRADFLGHCGQHADLVTALTDAQVLVGPMNTDELRLAITRPAEQWQCRVETALVARLVADTAGQPGALPLVSHALLQTWLRRRGTTLTLAGYETAGGIEHALARTAEETYASLDAHQQEVAKHLFLRLTALGDNTEDTKRRVPLDELDHDDPDTTVVLARLTEARLLSLGHDSVDIAHEALIRHWPRLRDWLHQDRETLRLHRQLTHDSGIWDTHERDPDMLYRGVRLAAWDGRGMARLNERERAFLAESRQRVAQEARVRRRRLRLAVTALAAGLVVTTVLALVAVAQADRARDERDRALARQLVANARDQLQIDQELAVLLAREAYDTKPIDEAAAVLRQAVADSRVRAVHSSGQTQVFGVAYSPDGRRLASSGADGTIQVWRLEGPDRFGESPQVLQGHAGYVWSPVFSRDGRWLAAGGNDDAVTVWDLVGGGAPIVLRGHGGGVSGVAVSPSGERVAATGDDGLVHLWDRADPQRSVLLPLGGGPGLAVAFSADGAHLAAGGVDREVRVWRGDGVGPPVVLRGHEGEIEQITFSPDGKRLASGSYDTTVRIWNTSGEGEPLVLRAGDGTVETVAFSPDGRRIASGHSGSDTIRVWNTTAGELPNPLALHGHDGPVWSVKFSPDGRRLASGSGDGTIRLWDPAYPGTPQVMYGHEGPAYSVAVSRDGRTIASSGLDGTVRLWRTPNRRDPLELRGHDGSVRLVVVSADGRWVASAGRDRTVRIWDAVEGRAVAVLKHDQPVRTVAFSPDDQRVASGGSDGAVMIWPANGRGAPIKLHGHDHSEVWSVTFSLDGQSVASAGQDSAVRIQRIDGDGTPRVIRGGPGLVWCVAFTPDGQHLVTCGDDGSIRIWRGDGQGSPRILRGHRGPVWGMAISSDGRQLATAGADGTLRIRYLPDGRELVVLRGHGASVEQVAFRLDSAGLFTALGDGTVRLIHCEVCGPIDNVRTMADSRVTRSLTAEERETYLGEPS